VEASGDVPPPSDISRDYDGGIDDNPVEGGNS
jgi:hypothetical protein